MMRDRGKKVAFATLGCKANQYDTEEMRERLAAAGYRMAGEGEAADVYIVNTCTVTKYADKQGRQLIRRAIREATGAPAPSRAKVVAAGCYAQVRPEELKSAVPDVDLIVGTLEKGRIVEMLDGLFGKESGEGPQVRVSDVFSETTLDSPGIGGFDGRTRACIKIQDGCDKRCSFCVIPFARGASRSAPVRNVLNQARGLAAAGLRETTLTGIYIGRYGGDLAEKASLAQLLRELAKVDGIERIRISSIDPREFDDELIDAIGQTPKVCRHFHISAQSGDDETLRAMRRGYRAADYLALTQRLAGMFPEVCIGSDAIVGFPGETERRFENSLAVMEAAPLGYLHVFPYSDRPGTAASAMPGKLPPGAIRERAAAMNEVRRRKITAFIERQLGKPVSILVERSRALEAGHVSGLTQNNLRVDAPGGKDRIGTFLDVVPLTASGERAVGRVLERVSHP